MRVFTERDTGGAPRNHAVAVHPSGLVYVANDVGLREFDGVTWRAIAGTERRMVFNVACDAGGRVFFSGPRHFGTLVESDNGTLGARFLNTELPEADREVGDVREIAVVGKDVYFLIGARRAVVRVDPTGGVHLIRLPEAVNSFLAWGGAVYVAGNETVFRIEADKVTPERDSPLGQWTARGGRIYAAWPRAEGGAWIVAREGLHRWAGDEVSLVSDEVKRLLGSDLVVNGCALGDGTFALGTRSHGLLIVDSEGKVLARHGEDNGLGAGSGYVEGLTLDADGGLWVAHDGGVTRVEVGSPGAIHGAGLGLRGRLIFALTLHRGRLHVGTSQGIFVRDAATGRFTALKGSPSNIAALISTEEGLIAAAERLVLLRDDGSAETIDVEAGNVFALLRMPRNPEQFVASTAAGLRGYRREGGRWRLEGVMASGRERFPQLHQDEAGWLWAVQEPWRVVRWDWRRGIRWDAPMESVGPAQGLLVYAETQSNVQLAVVGGVVMATSYESVLSHDPTTDRFVPETRMGEIAAAKANHLFFPLEGAEFWVARLGGPSRIGWGRRVGPGAWSIAWEPLSGFETVAPRAVLHDPATQTMWWGGQQLVSYDLNRPRFERSLPDARVRRVTTSDQKELWNGAGTESVRVLPPEQNGLTFSFAAPVAAVNAKGALLVGYRTRLDGFDGDWSAWSLATARTYTNLPPGDFVFRVQAGSEDYRHGREATWAFSVLPPWWRTWWCIGIAGVGGVGGVAGVTRWFANRALRRRLRLLETQSAVERERLRLARDLHDEIGSGLGRVILFAGEARRNQADPVKLTSALDRVRDSAQELVQHAREIVWAVSPQHDTLASVVERLGDYADETLRAAGIACRVETLAAAQWPAATLGSEARHSVFLAVKEAVHNCVKYSGAKTAEFRLEIAERHLVITLRDHGVGFAPGEMRGTGHGLRNLTLRAEALGGSAAISSAVGQGTRVVLRVPVAVNTQ